MIRWLRKRRRIAISLFIAGAMLAFVAHPFLFLFVTFLTDRDERLPLPPGTTDDASRLDQTRVSEVWNVPPDDAQAQQGLRDLLDRARKQGLRVSIAGARHSMGGQAISPGGIEINMLTHNAISLDESHNILHAQAGARWSEIVPYLDVRGRSVAVMQSNSSFSVGGSLSVNCHGWQTARPPIASTVESFRLMLADGSVVQCSRSEHGDLFSAVLGGYGLFGVILDADLQVVPNVRYKLRRMVMPTAQFVSAWAKEAANSPDSRMELGRLSVDSGNFLAEAILYVFDPAPLASGKVPALSEPGGEQLGRTLLLASVGSDYGKKLRWTVERDLLTHIAGEYFTRNQLLNVPAELLDNRTADSTDILVEYFIPPDHFGEFVDQLRAVVPRSGMDLLNVTLRDVEADPDSMLRYTDREMISFVMLFNQPRAADAEGKMQSLTQQLIDAALDCGGRYYLPYRLHATPRQFKRAYPQAEQFFDLKRHYDPEELFSNEFYEKYGRG